jgi:hypothetical protein
VALATGDPFLLFILIVNFAIIVGLGYVLFRVYRAKTRKVRKLR